MNRKALILLVLAMASTGSMLSYSITTTRRIISSKGTIKAINVLVFWDEACTELCTDVDWGALEPGDMVTKIVYVLNDGNTALTLTIYAENWQPPEAEQYLTFTGIPDVDLIETQAVVRVTFMLSVDSAIENVDSFSFNIVVEGEG